MIKCVFVTDLGEALVFSGSNPAEVTSWRQEGRYALVGAARQERASDDRRRSVGDDCGWDRSHLAKPSRKKPVELELAMLTRTIKPLWRQQVVEKRHWAWSAKTVG